MEKIQTVIKFYEGIDFVKPFVQITELQECNIKQDVSGVDTMYLTVSPDNENIRAGQKIELYEIKENIDILIFQGYIDTIIPNVTKLELNCKSQKGLMQKKIALSDKSYTNETLENILNDLLNDWNSTYGENWILDNYVIGNATKDFKLGDDLYGIIDELAGLKDAVWTVKDETIIIKNLLGEDKTSGEDFTEIVYNSGNPLENNITDIKVQDYSSVSNIIIGTDKTNKTTKSDAGSITQFGALAEVKSFREGDLDIQTQAYLDSKKARQNKYSVEIEPNSLPNVVLGDKIHLRIEGANNYLDKEGDVIVVTLDIVYKLKSKIINIGVSDLYVYEDNFIKKINKMNEEIALMKI